LINKLPTASLQFQVPYTVLFNKSPNYNFFRNFGCSCYPFLRPYNKHKLNFRSHECLFLGYSTSHKGYKCLSPNGKLYVSKDVIFNELKYPYNDLFPPLSNSVTSSKSDFLPTAHIPLVSTSPNELTHSSQHVETNFISVSVDPSRSLNTKFPNSQNVTSFSPLSNAEPNSVTNEHSNTVSDLNRNPSELSSTSSSQSHTVSSPCSSLTKCPSYANQIRVWNSSI